MVERAPSRREAWMRFSEGTAIWSPSRVLGPRFIVSRSTPATRHSPAVRSHADAYDPAPERSAPETLAPIPAPIMCDA